MRKGQNEVIQNLHENNILIDKREIWLTNPNSEEDDINPTVAAQFVKNITLLDGINQNPIIIHMCSGFGGYVEAGFIIYDAIRACRSQVIMLVHGCVASMSSIVLQAADTRIMMPNSYFMIHYGYISIDGQSMISAKSLMEKINNDSEKDLKIYVERCKEAPFFKGWKESRIKKFIKDKLNYKEDWYLSAEDSVQYGFADGILGEKGYESIDLFR